MRICGDTILIMGILGRLTDLWTKGNPFYYWAALDRCFFHYSLMVCWGWGDGYSVKHVCTSALVVSSSALSADAGWQLDLRAIRHVCSHSGCHLSQKVKIGHCIPKTSGNGEIYIAYVYEIKKLLCYWWLQLRYQNFFICCHEDSKYVWVVS